MTNFRKTALTALAVTVVAGGLFANTATANAMSALRTTPVESAAVQDVVQVKHHHHHHKHRHHFKHRWGYGHCFWIKKKFWDPYYGGYFWKPVKICR